MEMVSQTIGLKRGRDKIRNLVVIGTVPIEGMDEKGERGEVEGGEFWPVLALPLVTTEGRRGGVKGEVGREIMGLGI